MLKPMPKGSTALRLPVSTIQHVLIDTTLQTPANPPAPSRASEKATQSWQAYVNGGAVADDARYLQMSREEEFKYLETMRNTTSGASTSPKPARLIELSPEKKSVSENANLLIDLEVGPGLEIGKYPQSYAGAPSYKGKDKTKTCPNYLD
jgi:hypothetical protein